MSNLPGSFALRFCTPRYWRYAAWFCCILFPLNLAVFATEGIDEANSVDFVTDVRPILSDRCFTCHGPDSAVRATELRLDDEASVHQLAVVPGDADSSELIRRIESTDPDEVMPPPDSNLQLSSGERDVLRRWVDSGAKFSKHWAFVAPRAASVEELIAEEVPDSLPWRDSKNPIDRLVARRLSELGLPPSPEADPATLIRRLSLDLTGLPPPLEELADFERACNELTRYSESLQQDVSRQPKSDDSWRDDYNFEKVYEQLIDRLLADKRFGEKWAVDWLDVARYADTFGYQADVYRAMWPWRDWVIEALNQNLPYDQFITWQVAGDLLPNPTREQILATAFNRNHRQTNEGGSVEEEFRSEYVADRVNTFGAAFLGLTLECARCHDHKYDPISQREYYQLASFFNSIDESGLYSHFTSAVPTPALQLFDEQQQSKMAELASRIAQKEQQLLAVKHGPQSAQNNSSQVTQTVEQPPTLLQRIENRLSENRIGHYRFEEIIDNTLLNEANGQRTGKVSDQPEIGEGISGNGVLLSGENNATMPEGGNWTRNQPFSFSLWVKIPRHFDRCVLLHRSRAWTDAASRGYELLIEEGRLSAGLIHFWPGNAIRVQSEQLLPIDEWIQIAVTYDGSSRAAGLKLYWNGSAISSEVVRDGLTHSIHGDEAKELTIGQRFRDVGFKDGRLDELQIFEAELSELEIQAIYWQIAAADDQESFLADAAPHLVDQFHRFGSQETREIESELLELRNAFSQLSEPLPEIMVMKEMDAARPTFILHRGEYDAQGESVERGVLSGIFPLPDDLAKKDSHRDESTGLNRLDLARWLTHADNPLTARVAVNRIWQSIFGSGLVSTSEDFGFQGAMPTHPELLDWLSVHFIESGWDVKALIKLIITSNVYRQQSDLTPELLSHDPENRWLSRGPAVRLSAEAVRDSALFAGGMLVDTLGGPPVKPYQPDGLWEEKSGAVYQRDVGEGSRRRSLYTFWKRTSPPPMMMTFDASNREVCVVRRQSTMTPLQTLVLWNDPQFIEAARGLAETVCRENGDLDSRLTAVFRRLISRSPTSSELEILSRLYQEQFDFFGNEAEAVEKFLVVGDHRVDESLDKRELASLTVVAQGLISFDDFVMKR